MPIYERQDEDQWWFPISPSSRRWVFECDDPGCYWASAHESEDLAFYFSTNHPPCTLPVKYGEKVVSDLFWDKLDELTELIMENRKDPNVDATEFAILRGEARGVAWCVRYMCQPYYDDVEEVSREAYLRYMRRTSQRPAEPSPHEIRPNGHHPDWQPGGRYRAARGERSEPRVTVTAEQEKAAKIGLAAGIPMEQLSKALSLPVETLKRLR